MELFGVPFVEFSSFLIPRAPSRSNQYVDNVGGYHTILIRIRNFPNAPPWVENHLSLVGIDGMGWGNEFGLTSPTSARGFAAYIRFADVDAGAN